MMNSNNKRDERYKAITKIINGLNTLTGKDTESKYIVTRDDDDCVRISCPYLEKQCLLGLMLGLHYLLYEIEKDHIIKIYL